jgi:hypothetical protein
MIYAYLADGRDQTGLRELDMMLAGTEEEKEVLREQQNMEEMRRFEASMRGMPVGRPR